MFLSGYYNHKTKTLQYFACFFVAYVDTDATAGNFLFNIAHDTGLESVADGKQKKEGVDITLAKYMANHKNPCVIQFIQSCNRYVAGTHASSLFQSQISVSDEAMEELHRCDDLSWYPCR